MSFQAYDKLDGANCQTLGYRRLSHQIDCPPDDFQISQVMLLEVNGSDDPFLRFARAEKLEMLLAQVIEK